MGHLTAPSQSDGSGARHSDRGRATPACSAQIQTLAHTGCAIQHPAARSSGRIVDTSTHFAGTNGSPDSLSDYSAGQWTSSPDSSEGCSPSWSLSCGLRPYT